MLGGQPLVDLLKPGPTETRMLLDDASALYGAPDYDAYAPDADDADDGGADMPFVAQEQYDDTLHENPFEISLLSEAQQLAYASAARASCVVVVCEEIDPIQIATIGRHDIIIHVLFFAAGLK